MVLIYKNIVHRTRVILHETHCQVDFLKDFTHWTFNLVVLTENKNLFCLGTEPRQQLKQTGMKKDRTIIWLKTIKIKGNKHQVCVHCVLTWDVVDGDGEDQEKNSPPAASCPSPLFLGFTLSFLSVCAARMSSFSSLIDVAILYFICVRERNRNNHRGSRSYGLSSTEKNHTCITTLRAWWD